MSAVVLAIATTIAVGIFVTVVACVVLARFFKVELAVTVGIISIIATIVLAVLAQPFARWWDEILGESNMPSAKGGVSVTPPVVGDCKFRPDQEIPVSISLRTTDPQHTQSDEQNGRYHLRFEPYYTWAGYLIDLPEGACDYRLELTAQLLPNSRRRAPKEGWGYGIGPCNVWTAGAPRGFVLQYAAYQQSINEVINSSAWFVNPDVNNGTLVAVPSVDNSEHQWVFNVRGNDVTVTEDFGQDIGTYTVAGSNDLPQTCRGRDIFIRVFNANAVFTGIRVVAR